MYNEITGLKEVHINNLQRKSHHAKELAFAADVHSAEGTVASVLLPGNKKADLHNVPNEKTGCKVKN